MRAALAMDALKSCLGAVAAFAIACGVAHAQAELMDFTGRERPGMVMIVEYVGVLRHRPDLANAESVVKLIKTIGEGFLDVETALPTSELAAGRPQITAEILAEMDTWTNKYQRPWSVASYGGPLTPERKLAHTIRFNTGFILHSPTSDYRHQDRLEKYILSDVGVAKRYKDNKCPRHKRYVAKILNPGGIHFFVNHETYDEIICHKILYEWFQRNVSEFASLSSTAAISELFAWYHSPYYSPGDLPREVEEMIEGWKSDSGYYWRNGKYEGKRYEDIWRDLTANLAKVNAGWLPDAPEAEVADFSTMLFLIVTGRLLEPAPGQEGNRP